MTIVARLVHEQLLAAATLDGFMADLCDAGAVVSFCGIARPRSGSGAAVERLRLEHHPRLTLRSLEQIADEGAARFEVSDVLVVHRHGIILPGETIVFVATASRHRRAAFHAADYLMDRLKTEAVFWKKEEGVDGGRWIEPTEADRADVARWGE